MLLSGDRLSNIRIGVTQTSPRENTPSVENIYVCARQDTQVLGTQTFPCAAFGKYVVILIEARNSILTLCEVEVESREY